jgi:hypothetical protein
MKSYLSSCYRTDIRRRNGVQAIRLVPKTEGRRWTSTKTPNSWTNENGVPLEEPKSSPKDSQLEQNYKESENARRHHSQAINNALSGNNPSSTSNINAPVTQIQNPPNPDSEVAESSGDMMALY